MAQKGSSPLLVQSRQCGFRYQIRALRLAVPRGAPPLPNLPSIQHQTLVLCGDDDPLTPNVNHRVIARLILSARLHTVAGRDLVLLDSAHEIGPVITAFLRGATGRLAM